MSKGKAITRRLVGLLIFVVVAVLGTAAVTRTPDRHIVVAGTLEAPRPLREVVHGSADIAVVRPTDAADVHWSNAANTEWSPDALIYSDREFVVETSLKGDPPTRLRVRLLGGTVNGVTMSFEDQAELVPGRRYIVFLSERQTPTQGGTEVAWTIAAYEGVFEEGTGDQWRNHVTARETTVEALRSLLQ